MENSLAKLAERVFGAVSGLRENEQRHLVVHHVYGLLYSVTVFFTDGAQAVTHAENGQNFGPAEELCYKPAAENIASGYENLLASGGIDQHQGIHQGIAVIAGKYARSGLGNVVSPSRMISLEAAAYMMINEYLRKKIQIVVVLNLTHFTPNLKMQNYNLFSFKTNFCNFAA
jgi:hypothetical protein